MAIFICIIKTILVYIILMLVGTNLLGLVTRGIIPSYKEEEGNHIVIQNIPSKRSLIITIICTIASIGYFYALYHFFNIGIVISGLLIMFSRLPDLLFEMKTGKKVSLSNMSKRPIDIFCSILYWAVLPLIYYSLCNLPSL